MQGENMAKDRPKCCQIAKIFVTATFGKYHYGSGKAWKTSGIFFSYFVATLS